MGNAAEQMEAPVGASFFDWRRFEHETFRAEYAIKGDDIVYHFFPAAGKRHFGTMDDVNRFAKKLNDAFKRRFPSHARVSCDYVQGRVTEEVINAETKKPEHVAVEIAPMGEVDGLPQDALHVTAHGFAHYPSALRFAGDDIMQLVVDEVRTIGT